MLFSLVALAAPATAQPLPAAQPAPDAVPASAAEPPPVAQPAPTEPGPAAQLAPAAEPRPPAPPPAPAPAPARPAVTSKWDATLYGFIEGDAIRDSTQGLNDNAGNTAIARAGSYAAKHGQFTQGARNSRIGVRITPPVTASGIKATGVLEMDFVGNQPPGLTESGFFVSPTFRLRQGYLRLETPILDVVIGQYWDLFGWQAAFHPGVVQITGIPGEVLTRAAQIRLGKRIPAGPASIEVAIAAVRPPQRDSGTPDAQAGIKLNLDTVKAYHTASNTTTTLDSAAIGVSVVGRRFAVDEFSAKPGAQVVRDGYGISLDAILPVLPATATDHGNALTITASYVNGAGTADLYSALSGGVSQAALPNPDKLNPAPVYTPNIDNGLALFSVDGTLHPIQWTTYIVGAQYYLPPSGRVFLTANYSHASSSNAHAFGAASKVFDKQDWADGNLFVDLTPAIRLGAEVAWTNQTYVDAVEGTNYRVQLSGFLLF
jgi:hypothetical protein